MSQDQGVDYLVMECVPGRSLADTLKSGPMPEREAVSLVAQIADALEDAHEQHIVHRDLKPGNIMVTPRGQAKVLDFGLAQLLSLAEPGDLTRSAEAAGFGPGTRQESPMLEWSRDTTSLFVSLKSFGLHAADRRDRAHRSSRPLDSLWPKGLKSEKDVLANPGAKMLNESTIIPHVNPSTYLIWRRTNNLYRIPLSN